MLSTPPGVQVDLLPQELHRHRRALDIPTGVSATEGTFQTIEKRRPGSAARQGKIGGMVLFGIGVGTGGACSCSGELPDSAPYESWDLVSK